MQVGSCTECCQPVKGTPSRHITGLSNSSGVEIQSQQFFSLFLVSLCIKRERQRDFKVTEIRPRVLPFLPCLYHYEPGWRVGEKRTLHHVSQPFFALIVKSELTRLHTEDLNLNTKKCLNFCCINIDSTMWSLQIDIFHILSLVFRPASILEWGLLE